MKNFAKTLRNIDSRFLNLGFLALAILGYWINHWVYFICLFTAALLISILKFVYDKNWIASADKYIRVIVHRSLIERLLETVLLVSLFLLYFYFNDNFESSEFMRTQVVLVWTFLSVIIYYGNYFIKFVDSIKTFDEGIQLPGRKSEVIPWKEIYSFTQDGHHVKISSSKGEHEFDIDPEDYRYTRAIIADWKLKNGRRNLGL